jgi:hypothetical protein
MNRQEIIPFMLDHDQEATVHDQELGDGIPVHGVEVGACCKAYPFDEEAVEEGSQCQVAEEANQPVIPLGM